MSKANKGAKGKDTKSMTFIGKLADMVKGVLTCGLSFAPSIVKEVKQLGHKDEAPELPASPTMEVDSLCDIVDIEE